MPGGDSNSAMIGGKTEKSGNGLVVLTSEDPAEFGDDVVGVGSAAAVVLEVVGGTKGFETHPVIERRAHPLVDVGVRRADGRSIRQRDLHVAVVDITGGEPHQRADLLGTADTAALEVTHRPRAITDDAEFVEIDRVDPVADHRLHRIAPELGDLHPSDGIRHTVSTAAPETSPAARRRSAVFASPSGYTSATVRIGTSDAIARNSSASRRVKLATLRSAALAPQQVVVETRDLVEMDRIDRDRPARHDRA